MPPLAVLRTVSCDSFASTLASETVNLPKNERRSWTRCSARSCISRSPSKRRHVRFVTDKRDRIQPHVISSASDTVYDDDDIQNIWWSPAELEQIRQQARVVSTFHARFCLPYCKSLATLLIASLRTGATSHALRLHDCVAAIVNSHTRGLENIIVPMLELHRQRAVQTLLDLQCRTRRTVPSELRTALLARQYARSSRYASVWARVLADGDALLLEQDEYIVKVD